jgi:hypothetical protein
MARALALPVLFVALGCSRAWPGDYWLVLGATPGSGVQLAHAEVSPSDALVEGRREPGRVSLRLRRDIGSVRVSAPGGCPLVVEVPAGGRVERRMEPLFTLGETLRVVGPARRFEIRAEPRCDEARRSRVDFRVAGGAQLDDVRVDEGGHRFSATTRGVEVAKGATWGIVPVSANERGVTQIDVHIRQSDGFVLERRLEVAALTRSSGLPNVALGHGVLLAGSGFRLEKKPHGSRAELRPLGALAELVPDVRGDFELVDAAGRSLLIQSGRYDEMPLDCGRSDCHATIAASARESPMTRALSHRLMGERPALTPECGVACHATGEPGIDDGGFAHIEREMGLHELPRKYDELPRSLRRVGGVGCLACHGPAAIPPESARWAVLRSDVCAVCHDAPPRYAHVAAYATTKMAKPDPDESTQESPCARCHTTWGARAELARRPPPEVGTLGIGCVACHDVHPTPPSAASSSDGTHGLLRRVDVARVLPDAPPSANGPSRVCIGCHAPGSELLPAASAAAVWAGRGGLDPKSGEALAWPAPHAGHAGGCLSCHGARSPSTVIRRYVLGDDGDVRGERHAFSASAGCGPCHDAPPKRRPELAVRARAVLDVLLPLGRGRTRPAPIHAAKLEPRLTGEKARALYNVLLVLEDGAADVHNPAYAEMLVASAEKASGVSLFFNRRLEETPP